MKSIPLLFLGIVLVTGVHHKPSASEECKLQRILLKEIIEHVNVSKGNKNSQILVGNVITPKTCTCENFCRAGKVLSAFKADWLLHRTLVAFSRNVQCEVSPPPVEVEFHKLLENIKMCAQKKYRHGSCDQTELCV